MEHLIDEYGGSNSLVDFKLLVRDGVRVELFFKHFKGSFKGIEYDCASPSPMMFENALPCRRFRQFVSSTILDWFAAGVLSFRGRKGECDPPYLVLPLTGEPTKPRLCHDERFLNLWIRDLTFKLDHLPDLPRYVFPDHF